MWVPLFMRRALSFGPRRTVVSVFGRKRTNSCRWESRFGSVSVERETLVSVSAVQLAPRCSRVDGARPSIVTRGFGFVTVSRRYPSPTV